MVQVINVSVEQIWILRNKTLQTLLGHTYTDEEINAWKDVHVDSDAKKVNDRKLAPSLKGNDVFPRRQYVPGQTSGLTLFLKQKAGNLGCVRTEGTGFRVS